MKLTLKVILIIVLTVTSIISGIFYLLTLHFEEQMEKQLLNSARVVYNHITIVRQWVSDNEGVFVVKGPGKESNPFLKHPDLYTTHGDTLTLRNPALITRELSDLTYSIGKNFSFHLTSLNYINPSNKPDDFEKSALLNFNIKPFSDKNEEYYRTELNDNKRFFRYFAPLYTEESCLSCHADQGYKLGDVRGGISILLPMDQFQKAQKENLIFYLKSALFTICFLSILIFIALQRSVINPLKKIEDSVKKMREGIYDFRLQLYKKDEIGNLAVAFEEMRKKIKKYTGQLKTSESKYRSLIEHSLEAVAIINSKGNIIECNSKLTDLSGYDSEELKSLNIDKLINVESKIHIHNNINQKLDSQHYETILASKYQINIPVEIYIIKGFSLSGIIGLSFVYILDLSERKKIEQYSLQTEKMHALGQLSSGIAHEIRNPLFALNNNLEFLKTKYGKQSDFREIYPDFKNGIDRMQNIVSAILDYAKPHDPSFKEVEINEIIEKSLVLVQKQFEESSIQIETDYTNINILIEADPHQLEQVFINLFLNSFQAMKYAGVLKIRTKTEKKCLMIEIEDSGIGIPDDEIDHIFNPFYSKSPNGTGLGMAIVQRILDQHNADYQVKSQVGMGTVFKMVLPYKQG